MAIQPIRLAGKVTDDVLVVCDIVPDPDRLYLDMGSMGWSLVLPCVVTSPRFEYYGGSKNRLWYDPNGRAELLTVSGRIGLNNNNKWGLELPVHSQRYGALELRVPIRDADLEAIENVRAGGHFDFALFMIGLAQVYANPVVFQGQKEPLSWSPSAVVCLQSSDGPGMGSGYSLRVNRDLWIGILNRAGRQQYVVELPFPGLPAHDEAWKQVIGHLSSAEASHRTGGFEDALSNSRKVVEGIVTVLAKQWNVPKRDPFASWAKELSRRLDAVLCTKYSVAALVKPKRSKEANMLDSLIAAAWDWASSAAHYGGPLPKREEAALAVHLATNLLVFAAQLLSKYPDVQLTSSREDEVHE